MNNTKKWIVSLIVGLVVLLVILWGVWQAFLAPTKMEAVKLNNGSLYFGEVVRFPDFGLKNVYTIQRTGNKDNPLQVRRFRNSFWGPKDFMRINKDQILWRATLRQDSRLVQIVKQNPNLNPPRQGNQPPGGAQQAPTQNGGTNQPAPQPAPQPDQNEPNQ